MKHKKLLLGLVLVLVLVVAWAVASNTKRPQSTETHASALSKQAAAAAEVTHQLLILKDGFEPSSLTIKKGESIEWKNVSGKSVSIYSDPHPAHTGYAPLNIGVIENNFAKLSNMPDAGEYTYHNEANPKQTGTIIVE